MDGVSVTYGQPRQHIWTFAAAIRAYNREDFSLYPCTNNQTAALIDVPRLSDTTTFVRLDSPVMIRTSFTRLILCGTARAAARTVSAALSTIPPGSVDS